MLGAAGAVVLPACKWLSQVCSKHLSKEPVLDLFFLMLSLNPPVVHSPVSDGIQER